MSTSDITLHTKLDRFIAAFQSEAELRVSIMGLLERMPNISGVRLTHGTTERGKDIVFHWTGAFGERHLVACVIKYSKIKGSVDSDDGARTVYIQAEQAIDTQICDTSGVDERVGQVYIITPHDCSVEVMESIKGKLQSRPGQVTFLCGHGLMQKFEKFYPDFLLFQSGLFSSYAAELERGLDTDPAVANVLFRHGFLTVTKTLSTTYVRPKFERSFHSFKLAIEPPKLDILRTSITEAQSESLQKSIRDFGALFTAVRMPDEAAAKLSEILREIANDINRGWQEAFEVLRRRTDLTAEERRQARSAARVQLSNSEILVTRASDALAQVTQEIADFSNKLSSANQYISVDSGGRKIDLTSPRLLDYCDVENIAKQVPSLVRISDTSVRGLHLSEDFIDELSMDFLISGPAGFGKTSFCRWQALHDLKRLRDKESDIVPVYVPLHQFAQVPPRSFEADFLRASDLIGLWQRRRESRHGAPIRRFRLYLDGLDEVPSARRQSEILSVAVAAKSAEPTLQVIVTAREHVVGSHLHGLPRVRVREFDDKQVRELAMNWFDRDAKSVEAFFKQMESVPSLQPLMHVPLLATLILGVYRNTDTLPESRVTLYEMFVNLLAGGWDVAKKVQRESEFGPIPKLTVLTRLATMLHMDRKRDAAQLDFKTAVNNTLPGLRSKWKKLLQESVQDGLLIPTGLTFAFAHLSFQEFFTAKDLFDPSGRRAAQVFTWFLADDQWWREVTAFYVEISKKPKEIEQFIRSIAQKVVSRNADETVWSRVDYLLKLLMTAYPGAEPRLEKPSKRQS